MLRRLQAFLVLGMSLVGVPAAAQEPADAPASAETEQAPSGAFPDAAASEDREAKAEEQSAQTGNATTAADQPPSETAPSDRKSVKADIDAAQASAPEVEAEKKGTGWETFASGYFRAPMAIGISTRPGPDDITGPPRTQLSYGPNRTVDANYYSFAYTRLQEQDWAEVFVHAKRKHVEAVVGWMGYWYQSVGFRNNDAAWAPGMAYLKLDTDLDVGGLKTNLALTAGAFWPQFGYFEKYDTFTLGRFRQMGEQLRWAIAFSPDLTLTLFQGFGTGRDGSSNIVAPPPYQATVGLDLIHYEHIQLTYKKYVDIGLHYNTQWTRDPNLTQQVTPGKAYADARDAHFTNVGGEATLSAPFAGRLWVSPSFTSMRNGWALGEAGTELMHSLSGEGFATNYLVWNSSPPNSTGSGSSFNLGFLYENTLSSIQGKTPDGSTPEVTLNVFGLLAQVDLDLPATSTLTQDEINQFKYGADVTFQALNWLGFTARFDEVNYDQDNPGYVFSAITGRATFSSNFLSGERIYLQYSRYRYGEKMVLSGKWPWGLPLVAGADIIQGGTYAGHKPDMDVVKLQADVKF
jgi:hypothetical protein